MDKNKLASLLDNLDYGSAPEQESKTREWLKNHGSKFCHSINGAWRPPEKGGYFKTINPAKSDEVLAEIAMGTQEDVNAAIHAAKAAFPAWSALSGHKRARYLYAIARAVAKHGRIFAVLESLDNGKPIRETRDIDVPVVIRHFYYHAGWAQTMEHEFPGYRPGGVVAQIIPWNFPFLMLAWKIAPAIAAGNTVVLKPSKSTPLTALLLADILMNEVKLPPGVVNILTGDSKTGTMLYEHPVPWKVTFTGSTEVGRIIRKGTAGSRKHLTMELGGKSPFIVFENADLDSAVEGVVNGIWFNEGQVCCAGSRLLVQEGIHDDFIKRLKRRMSRLRVGNPLDKTVDMGAINNAEQLKKITEMMEVGKKEGATMWQPDNVVCPKGGYFLPPTLFTNVEPSHTIAQEEIFGPVLVTLTFRTPAEAVQLGNNTRYGLAASIWSQDIDTAMDVARKIRAGTVWINSTNLFDAAAGFGGYKESGYGREGGREGMYDVLVEADHGQQKISEPASSQPPINQLTIHQLTLSSPTIDRTFRFLIGGKLARPDQAGSYSVTSPSGQLLAVVGEANRKDVRNAVEAARTAFPSWFDSAAHLRAQILYFWAENLSVEKERFADGIAAQTGCSIETANIEVEQAISRLFDFAAYADKFGGMVQPVLGRRLVVGLREPIGVVGMRASDNSPLLGLISVLAPAVAMANTAVAIAGKHAITAMDLVQIIQHSDVPAGVINLLTAQNPDVVAKVLAEHEDVDAIWSFGGSESGKAIEEASTGNMKQTWVTNGGQVDWATMKSEKLLLKSTQVKNIWVPYGV
ncbi:MAG: aldehyde dehydrogenase family protein [Ignavibacteriales bacterium]|nr:aldehyde dehydrogenase family protein [Ignavibacteriales bacterium]